MFKGPHGRRDANVNLSSIRRLMPVLAVALAISPAFATPASAQSQYDLGAAAYQRQDYTTAYRLWRPLADQGNADAQFHLGVMYNDGQGVPQDYAEALRWYRLAAAQGYAGAQYNLGSMYNTGRGVPQDYAEVLRWYRLAAAQGHAGAQNNLGFMYSDGRGVPQDYVQAHKWYNLAASQYSATEAEDRDVATKNRDLVAAQMNTDQIAEAQRLAREWVPTK